MNMKQWTLSNPRTPQAVPKLSCKEIITDASSAIRNELGDYTSVELRIYIDLDNYCI